MPVARQLAADAPGLRATYYADPSLDRRVVSRVDPAVDFNWAAGAPAVGVPVDGFSARWRGHVRPAFSETYTFIARADGGVRLWVNGQLLINDWASQGQATERQGTIELVAGTRYDIRLEYFDTTNDASLQLSWQSAQQPRQVIPASHLFAGPEPAEPAPGGTEGFNASYFEGTTLAGQPLLTRVDSNLDFDWGTGSPAAQVPADNFSARWRGLVRPRFSETYTFITRSGDGVRLWVNGQPLVNRWTSPGTITEDEGTITLTAGVWYDIQVEYFEATGGASLQLSWSSASQIRQPIPSWRLSPGCNDAGLDTIAVNGGFECDISGWVPGYWRNPGWVAGPTSVARVAGARGTQGAIQVTLPDTYPADAYPSPPVTYYSGLQAYLKEQLPAGSWVRVAFDARRVAGSPYLGIERPFGGSVTGGGVTLSDAWQSYALTMQLDHATEALIFNLHQPGRQYLVAGGQFELDNVSVTKVPLCTDVPAGTRDRELVCFPPQTAPGQALRVAFSAATLSGPPNLRANGPRGIDIGDDTMVTLGATMSPHQVTVRNQNANQPLSLRLVPHFYYFEPHGAPGAFDTSALTFSVAPECNNNPGLETVAMNGGFECDRSFWSPQYWIESERTWRGDLISLAHVPGAGGSQGGLRVTFPTTYPPGVDPSGHVHQAGAVAQFTQHVPEGFVTVSFDARRISGSPHLILTRPSGGSYGIAYTQLTDDWQRHSLTFRLGYPTNGLYFSLWTGTVRRVAPGAFDIDNIRIAAAPTVPVVVTVTTASGAPVAGRRVLAYKGFDSVDAKATTDAAGRATVLAPTGTYRFGASDGTINFYSGTTDHCNVVMEGGCRTATIRFGGEVPNLAVTPETIAPGATVDVTWRAIANVAAGDHVSLYAVGAPGIAFIARQPTGGTASGNARLMVPATTAIGNYEARLTAEGGVVRATSNVLRVAAWSTLPAWVGDVKLIRNPSFEQNLLAWDGQSAATDVRSGYTIGTGMHGPRGVFRTVGRSTADHLLSHDDQLVFPPAADRARRYYVSAKVKTVGAARAAIRLYGNGFNTPSPAVPGNTAGTRTGVIVEVPAGTTPRAHSLRLETYGDTVPEGESGTAHFDDIRITALDPTVPGDEITLLDNPSFEQNLLLWDSQTAATTTRGRFSVIDGGTHGSKSLRASFPRSDEHLLGTDDHLILPTDATEPLFYVVSASVRTTGNGRAAVRAYGNSAFNRPSPVHSGADWRRIGATVTVPPGPFPREYNFRVEAYGDQVPDGQAGTVEYDDIRVQRAAAVRVTVLAANGTPVSGALVNAIDGAGLPVDLPRPTDASGSTTFGLLPGSHRFTVQHAGGEVSSPVCDPTAVTPCRVVTIQLDELSGRARPTGVCVVDKGGGTFDALFAYNNTTTTNISAPLDTPNAFAPAPTDRGQPRWLLPGNHAFKVTFNISSPGDQLTWMLGNESVSASPTSPRCQVEPGTGPQPDRATVGGVSVALDIDPVRLASGTLVDTDADPEFQNTPGKTPGTFAVGDDGAATYTIPIVVPPGRAGMEPDLALRFSSLSGNGAVGVGWSLVGTGFSQITRCNRTVAHDGMAAPVVFDSRDRFCLDGSRRLVAISGEYGAEGTEYRTEEDMFAKIVSRDVDAQGPQRFEVRLKDGRIFTYGGVGAIMQGRRVRYLPDERTGLVSPVETAPVRYAWAVSRIEDRSQNAMFITYRQNEDPADDFAHEFFPALISYTGHSTGATPARKQVFFEYDVTPAGVPARPDVLSHYVSGFKIRTSRRLIRIHTSAPATADALAERVRSYELSYEVDPASQLSRLTTVQECDSKRACKRPTTFTWSHDPITFEDAPLQEAAQSDVFDGEEPGWIIQPADVNGDGFEDLLYRKPGTRPGFNGSVWYYRLASKATKGESFESPVELGLTDRGTGDLPRYFDPRVVDFDLDNKSDLFVGTSRCLSPQVGSHWLPFRSNGSAYTAHEPDVIGSPETQLTRGCSLEPILDAHFADLTGDGLPDVARPMYGVSEPFDPFLWGVRLNTDGRFDNYRVLSLASFPLPATLPPDPIVILPASTTRGSYVVDVDGAHRAALFVPQATRGPTGYTKYYPGGIFPDPRATTDHRVLTEQATTTLTNRLPNGLPKQHVFADVNGDGLIDAVGVPESGGEPVVYINYGGDFTAGFRVTLPRQHWTGQFFDVIIGPNQGKPVDPGIRVGDVNQDGRQDLILMGHGDANNDGCGTGPGPRRTIAFLLSTGTGFAPAAPSPAIPIGIPANGFKTLLPACAQGYKLSQVLDANGDGLVDLIQFEPGGKLHLYLQRGKANRLENIEDGLGARIDITYRPISDPGVHKPGTPCRAPHTCPSRGLWVVSAHVVDNGTGTRNRFTHQYEDLGVDSQGRGFLGFSIHRIRDEARKTTVSLQYDHHTRDGTAYPGAGRLHADFKLVELDNGRRLRTVRRYRYRVHRQHGGATYFVTPRDVNEVQIDEGARPGDPSGTISTTITEFDPDDFGNITRRESVTVPRDVDPAEVFADIVGERMLHTWTHDNHAEPWLIGLQRSQTWKSTTPSGATETRTVAYDPDPTTGLLRNETIEPTDTADLFLNREFVRNARGQITDVIATDKTGRRRREGVTYDQMDGSHVASVTNAAGHTTKLYFDHRFGVLAARQDPNDVRTFWHYDRFGRLRAEDAADGGDLTLHYLFDVAGPMATSAKIEGGPQTTTVFDVLERPILRRATTFAGETSVERRTYDPPTGALATFTTPADPTTPPVETRFGYDQAGRLVGESTADGNVIVNEYVLRQVTTHDRAGKKRIVNVDTLGRVAESLDVAQDGSVAKTSYGYGVFGQLQTIIDPKTNETAVTYDRRGRRKTLRDPDSGLSSFTPDAFDEVADETDANETKTVYTRDALGRVTRRQIGANISTIDWDVAQHGIGSVGRSTSFDGVVKELGYDQAGRLTRQAWIVGGDEAREIRVGYDSFGRVGTIAYPETPGWPRLTVSYGYGDHGHLREVHSTDSGFIYWRVQRQNARDQILAEGLGENAVTASRTYHPSNGRLSTITADGAGGPIQRLQYDYTVAGNVFHRIDGTRNLTETYGYDHADRLTSWDAEGGARWGVAYVYDELGNLKNRTLSIGGPVTEALAFTYSGVNAGPHAVTSSPFGDYRYDKKGNQFDRPDSTVTYTSFDLPRVVTPKGTGGATTFAYDADDVRVEKITTGGAGRRTVYIGGLFESRQEAGAAHHIFYIIGPGRTVAQVERSVAGGALREDLFFLQADHLGTIESITDANGALLSSRKLDPFGNEVDPLNPALNVPGRRPAPLRNVNLGFTHQEEDFDLSLVNMNGRIYDPAISRFLTPDPIVTGLSSQALNRYSYVLNNPVNLVDPSGFQAGGVGDPFPTGGDWALPPGRIVHQIIEPGRFLVVTDDRPTFSAGFSHDGGFGLNTLAPSIPGPMPGVIAPTPNVKQTQPPVVSGQLGQSGAGPSFGSDGAIPKRFRAKMDAAIKIAWNLTKNETFLDEFVKTVGTLGEKPLLRSAYAGALNRMTIHLAETSLDPRAQAEILSPPMEGTKDPAGAFSEVGGGKVWFREFQLQRSTQVIAATIMHEAAHLAGARGDLFSEYILHFLDKAAGFGLRRLGR